MNKVLSIVLLCAMCVFTHCRSERSVTVGRDGKRVLSAKEMDALKAMYTMPMPEGWHRSGSDRYSYDMGTDAKGSAENGKCFAVFSLTEVPNGFGTLMTNIKADKYRGKRIRLSGYIKSKDVKKWAGFWLRIDIGKTRQGDFDNMSTRAVKGNTDWKKYEVVLDVDSAATEIAYGALLSETGKIWFDKISLEIVGMDVPSTNLELARYK